MQGKNAISIFKVLISFSWKKVNSPKSHLTATALRFFRDYFSFFRVSLVTLEIQDLSPRPVHFRSIKTVFLNISPYLATSK